jgi:hypothetical protein
MKSWMRLFIILLCIPLHLPAFHEPSADIPMAVLWIVLKENVALVPIHDDGVAVALPAGFLRVRGANSFYPVNFILAAILPHQRPWEHLTRVREKHIHGDVYFG